MHDSVGLDFDLWDYCYIVGNCVQIKNSTKMVSKLTSFNKDYNIPKSAVLRPVIFKNYGLLSQQDPM